MGPVTNADSHYANSRLESMEMAKEGFDMSHWNYRVCKHSYQGVPQYDIREVYYRDDGSVRAWMLNKCDLYEVGVDAEQELRNTMVAMDQAWNYPVLDLDELEANLKK